MGYMPQNVSVVARVRPGSFSARLVAVAAVLTGVAFLSGCQESRRRRPEEQKSRTSILIPSGMPVVNWLTRKSMFRGKCRKKFRLPLFPSAIRMTPEWTNFLSWKVRYRSR